MGGADPAEAQALHAEAESVYYARVFGEYVAAKRSIGDPSDHINQAEFTRLMLTKARESMKAGKTPEETMKEFQSTLPAKFKDYNLAPGRGGPGGAFVTIFEELKQTTK